MNAGPERRRLHAGAWWIWALALGAAASRTTNPVLLGLILVVTGLVTTTCRTGAPWARSYGGFLKLALVVVVVRVVFHALLGGVAGPTELFRLPEVPLPDWAAGIRLGGTVSAEGAVHSLYDGLRLATLLVCVGAANSLADPKRLLRSLPAALYEVSVAVVVALTTAPSLVTAVGRMRRARELRGETPRGWRSLRSVLVPALEDALDRSLTLAAAMDSRGYGRSAALPAGMRRATGALVLGGLVGVGVGTYGLLDTTAPAALGGPLLAAGVAAATSGMLLGSRRVPRTRYRPDPWRWRETAVAASGLGALAGMIVTAVTGGGHLHPPFVPLVLPGVDPLAVAGVLAGLLPVVVAPPRAERLGSPAAHPAEAVAA